MEEHKKRLFTGLQPSGQLHIGNYFGALKPFVDTYSGFESFLMIADYHTLTSLKDPAQLHQNTLDIVRAYLAAGIDPGEATIFKQSDIAEHTELAWIFECLVTVPFLMQAHSYKDKVARGLEANAGLFNYPMLMAADILLYDTAVVPVGADQRQHVEYAREAAAKFNNAYGKTFKEPEEKISDTVAIVPGTDGQKMSKSYGNTIPLFGSKEEIAKAVMSIVTDSGTVDELKIIGENPPEKSIQWQRPINLYRIHNLFRTHEELTEMYSANQTNYKALKEALIEDIEKVVAPMREKYNTITDEEIKKVLTEGAAKAKAIASVKMAEVRQKIGVTL
jgi:tryptophanyl-tRNA synthetase